MHFIGLRSKIIFVATLALIGSCSLFAQIERRENLFFVAATFNGGGQWPVRLYRINSGQRSAVFVREVAGEAETILADYDARIMVIASPPLVPSVFCSILMDSPEKPERNSISYDTQKFRPEGIFLLNSGGGPTIALALGQLWKQTDPQPVSELAAVVLGPDSPARTLPWGSLRAVRTSGYVGGELPVTYQHVPEVRGNPLHILIDDPVGYATGVPRPPYLALSKDITADSYTLFAANNEITALTPFIPHNPSVVDVRINATGNWSRIQLPLSVSRPRAFGGWIAAIATEPRNPYNPVVAGGARSHYNAAEFHYLRTSPGRQKRQEERLSAKVSVEDLFDSSWNYYPGKLIVVNSRTQKIFTIVTDSGDSEVVLATDEAIYYRVDDSLYRAQFASGILSRGVLLVQGPEVAQAHWAFLGPPPK